MVNNVYKINTLAAVVLVACAMPVRTVSAYNEGLKTAAVVLGATAGLCAFGSWLLTPSDDDVLEQAHQLEVSLRQYEPLMNCMEQSIVRTNEELNAVLVREHCIATKSISVLLSDLKRDLERVDWYKSELRRRTRTKSHSSIGLAMQSALHGLNAISSRLQLLYAYLKNHVHYFALHQAVESLVVRYDRELNGWMGNSVYQKRDALGAIIYSVCAGSAYPYLTYVDKLIADKDYLDACTARAYSNYSEIAREAQELSGRLGYLKNVVMSDVEYVRALRDCERDRLERERRELQRQIAAQRAQAELQALHNLSVMHQLARPQVVVHEVVEYASAHVPAPVQIVHHEYTSAPQEHVVHQVVHHEYAPLPAPVVQQVVHHHEYAQPTQNNNAYTTNASQNGYTSPPAYNYASNATNQDDPYMGFGCEPEPKKEEDLVGSGYDDNYDNN